MADQVQIKIGADLGGALGAVAELKQAVAGVADPVQKLQAAFAGAGAAIRRSGSSAAAAFRAEMQAMVADRQISLKEALGFDLEYAAQRVDLQRADLDAALANDAATVADKTQAFAQLAALSQRSADRLAADRSRIAAAAAREAGRLARPYRQAFDEIGQGWKSAVTGLVEGSLTFQGAALRVAQSVERGFISMAETTLSRAAAGPLAALLGLAAPAAGEGVGDVLGNFVSSSLFGSATGGAASGGGLFGWLGGLFAFGRGGIVPSAARGWALPNFAGATPALLHAREMVLPAPISEGLQGMIAQGGPNGAGGGDMHLHFHGPSDGPAVQRWFAGLMSRNPGVVRDMLRSNALTPRSL